MNLISVEGPSVVPSGLMKMPYPTDRITLREETVRLLVGKRFIDHEVPLEDLHLHLREEDRVPTAYNNVTQAFFETSDRFREIYFDLMKYMTWNTFDFDFVFQETPNIRFHVPGPYQDMYKSRDGTYLGYHVDSMNGHPLEEINCWLPVTECYSTNALQLSSLENGIKSLSQLLEDINYNADIYHKSGWDLFYMKLNSNPDFHRFMRESCKPVAMKYGEVLLFDPRCVHATAENQEAHTRISLDFRLIPVETYNRMTRQYQSQGRTRRMFARGDVFYEKSAREL